ncbi:auxin-responsive protein IAA26 [Neltuma alba]|uniref:auxin-responsive protein IAA26 n=1 Tax=Neltuma alba TaxID=207710 RepID=UPI0010A3E82D|nr:auxin-responsive protein IAA26-like [Prosopis alba]
MDVRPRNEEVSPQLLDLIPKDQKEWHVNDTDEGGRTQNNSSNNNKNKDKSCCEERKLELRLGPPGEDWSLNHDTTKNSDESLLSLGYFSQQTQKISDSPWASSKASSFLQFPSCSPQSMPEKKAFSSSSSANPAAPSNISQKRTAPGPVVGWPPIRSFRKNLASNSTSKTAHETQQQHDVADKVAGKKPVVDNVGKGLFVKINMDGVPIGRKVDLSAYDSYEKLSSAVDELFRCLLAAQRDSSVGGIQNKEEEEKAITGLLDGSGEYTLVYEDNEGDRMLAGDVPWHMFVSTVKRLRVLKSSELSAFTLGNKQDKKTT